MRIFKIKWMARFVRREGIERVECGIIDAGLGGGLIKQRVARPGQGRSGGFRMIVSYRTKNRAFFLYVYGFAQNERDNIDDDELQILIRDIAADLLAQGDAVLKKAVSDGKLQEIGNGEEA